MLAPDSNTLSPPVRILGIIGSPRKGNTEILINQALQGALEVGQVEITTFPFYGKKFLGCADNCRKYCRDNGRCVLRDDFNQFLEAWLEADGIIFGAPVFHLGPPGQVKCALDRLGNVISSYTKEIGKPYFCKVSAALVQGGTRYGGQEITLQFFLQHFVLMNCLPIAGDKHDSYLGVAGLARPSAEHDSILKDEAALMGAKMIGRRVAQITHIVRQGILAMGNTLPAEYHVRPGNFWYKNPAGVSK